MNKIIEPNVFKMRLDTEFPFWKRLVWRILGAKDFGVSNGYYCEGYWFRGICLVTKCTGIEENEGGE